METKLNFDCLNAIFLFLPHGGMILRCAAVCKKGTKEDNRSGQL